MQIDGNSSGSVYNLNAAFRLIRIADKSVALTGTSYGRVAFQRFDSVFSNVRARNDAENRAATTVARGPQVAPRRLPVERRVIPSAIRCASGLRVLYRSEPWSPSRPIKPKHS